MDLFLSDKHLSNRFKVHRTTLWAWLKDEALEFPKPIRLSARCTRWKLSEIEAWEAKQASNNG